MSQEKLATTVAMDEPLATAEAYIRFCEAEFDRRKNTGESFDEAGYRQAMALTLQKLKKLEEEGYA